MGEAMRIFLGVGLFLTAWAASADEGRVLVVRERAAASLLDGGFTFEVLKLRGYSIDIRLAGERRTLKLGEGFQAPGDECAVVFEEISPETRIARFRTDCP